jgi:hypothetical protein
MPRTISNLLLLSMALFGQDGAFDDAIQAINRGRYDLAAKSLAPVQRTVREKAGVNPIVSEDLARRMRQIDSTPALMSSLALLRSYVESANWEDANGQAVIVGYGLGVLWARVPAYVKLEAAKGDLLTAANRNDALVTLTQAAMSAEDFPAAAEAARELAAKAKGAAQHEGAITLGLLAIREGNANQAETYLLQSGRVEADAILKQRGPRMSLAAALVESGRRSVVLKFLVDVEKWGWREGPKLLLWREELLAGKIPDFN